MAAAVSFRWLRPAALMAVAITVGVVVGVGVLPTRSMHGQLSPLQVTQLLRVPADVGGVAVTATALSPGGALGLGTNLGRVFVDATPGRTGLEPRAGERVARGSVSDIIFSDDSSTLAGTASDGTVWVWRRGKAPLSGQLPREGGYPVYVDGGLALSSGGGVFAFTDGNSDLWVDWLGSAAKTYPLTTEAGSPVFSADGRSIALSSSDGIESWQLASGQHVHVFASCPCEYALLSADWSTAAVDDVSYVEIWKNIRNPALVSQRLAPAGIDSIALSGNGGVLAIGTESGLVSVYDLQENRAAAVFRAASGGIDRVTLSANGSLLLVSPRQGRSSVWSIR
jgi:WD40 repeat protein